MQLALLSVAETNSASRISALRFAPEILKQKFIKPNIMKSNVFFSLALFLLSLNFSFAQETSNPKQVKIAVLGIDVKELSTSSESAAHITRLKLQKLDRFAVFRSYDVVEELKNANLQVSQCYSLKCLANAGKLLGADQMLSGTIERFGERIIISMILVDVESASIIRSDVNEYYNFPNELEGMIEISVNNLLDLASDPKQVNALEKKQNILEDQSIERLKLNGPRMGMAYVGGVHGQRMQDSKTIGGYEMLPIMTQFGYQMEWQYMSAGNMQALLEFIPLVSGMDQGRFIPSITMMNGFRHSKSGWEFAFGPTVRVSQIARGYYDDKKVWHLQSEWWQDNMDENGVAPENPYTIIDNLDSRGRAKLTYGFTIAAGKTFQSGHLNMPVNLFFTPSKDSYLFGASFGFNVRSKKRS